MYYLDRKFIVWWIYKRKGEGDGGGRSSSRKKCDIIRRFMIFQFRGFVFRDFRNFFHFSFSSVSSRADSRGGAANDLHAKSHKV